MKRMFTITKEFKFEASHVLTGLAEDHPCMSMHGHSYRVQIVLSSPVLNDVSFVQDYHDLSPIKEWLDRWFDHKFLAVSSEQSKKYGLADKECFLMKTQTSAENLSKFIYDRWKNHFPHLQKVGVSETAKTWAWYEDTDSLREEWQKYTVFRPIFPEEDISKLLEMLQKEDEKEEVFPLTAKEAILLRSWFRHKRHRETSLFGEDKALINKIAKHFKWEWEV